tara:strand:- start:1531 stop:1731 length:201 start_codon:yes stop_codon:yes gene_type:complete
MKPTYKCQLQIIDKGIEYPLAGKINISEPLEKNIQNLLFKWREQLCLSDQFQFRILSKQLMHNGTL